MGGPAYGGPQDRVDFFISYTSTDRAWAEWIAWQLKEAGASVVLQAWDMVPGLDFVHEMQKATTTAERTLAVLSPAYFTSQFSEAEWRVAFANDPGGEQRRLIPVRVVDFNPEGLLATRIYIDLVGKDRQSARAALLEGVKGRPAAVPMQEPAFPGEQPAALEAFQIDRAEPSFPNAPANSLERKGRSALSYDVFLSHSHSDGPWVESLAERLEDERGFKVWLDRWVLTPGKTWQQEMAKGLESTQTCAVCLGQSTPQGWFDQEIQRALDIQVHNHEYRVIPVLLPDAPSDVNTTATAFLNLRTWADFRDGQDIDYAFHVLCQGILGQPIGRWRAKRSSVVNAEIVDETSERLRVLVKLRDEAGLDEEIFAEYQRRVVDELFVRGIRRLR